MDLLFDLDGTLIDSAEGVLSSLSAALAVCGARPTLPLGRDLIGPPLRKTLQQAAGTEDPELLVRLVAAFMDHYDTHGCLATSPFPGVVNALTYLAAEGHRLFIVTNKRLAPTLTILRHLRMDPLFAGVHALDETYPPALSKADLVGRVLLQHGSRPGDGLLVGDSADDGRAALAHGLPFAFAEWGYGKLEDLTLPVAVRLRTLSDLDPARLCAATGPSFAENRPRRGAP